MKFKKWILTAMISVAAPIFGDALDQSPTKPVWHTAPSIPTAPKVSDANFYQKVSMAFLVPSYGLGYRQRSGNVGFDLSMNLYPYYYVNGVQARALFLTYFGKSSKANVPYLGLGATGSFTYRHSPITKEMQDLAKTYFLTDIKEQSVVLQGSANMVFGIQQKNGFWEIEFGVTPKFATTEKMLVPSKTNFDGKVASWSVVLTKGWNF